MNLNQLDFKIKQHTGVTYLGWELDKNLSGEFMVTKVLGKINGRIKYLCRKKFRSGSLRRMIRFVSKFEQKIYEESPNCTK